MSTLKTKSSSEALQDPEDQLSRLYPRLSEVLAEISKAATTEDSIPLKTREKVANAFFDHGFFLPTRIWSICTYHEHSIGHYGFDVNKWCKKKHLGHVYRPQGNYLTAREAHDRAEVMRKEVAQAGKVTDEEEEYESKELEGFQWAMRTVVKKPDSESKQGHISVLTTMHQVCCYISTYEADGPACIDPADDFLDPQPEDSPSSYPVH